VQTFHRWNNNIKSNLTIAFIKWKAQAEKKKLNSVLQQYKYKSEMLEKELKLEKEES
jgi:hypothetical protein